MMKKAEDTWMFMIPMKEWRWWWSTVNIWIQNNRTSDSFGAKAVAATERRKAVRGEDMERGRREVGVGGCVGSKWHLCFPGPQPQLNSGGLPL